MNTIEIAYVLRRVELNNRVLSEGQVPWSIRQTAVYHKFTPNGTRKSTFILIAPSATGESMLDESLDLGMETPDALAPFNIHRLLISDSLRNWQEYISYVDDQLTEQVSFQEST